MEPWLATAVYIACAFILVSLNAFFVLTEFAIVKARATHIETLVREGNRKARIVRGILGRLDAYLSACQLGVTVASLGLGWIGEPAFGALFKTLFDLPDLWSEAVSRSAGVGAAFVFITFIHLTIGEQAPKLLAIRRPETSIMAVAKPIRFFYFILYAPLTALNACSNFVLRLLGIAATSDEIAHSEQELRLILGMAQHKGLFPFERLLLFENLFDIGDLHVKNIMVPWEKTVFLRTDRPWEENREKIKTSRLSRYPLVDAEGKVLGFVHLKDFMLGDSALLSVAEPPLAKLARPFLTITPAERVDPLLKKFQQARRHMAVVMDQAKPVGIVTLEDVLEELVGSIEDEFERGPAYFLNDVMIPEAIDLRISSPSVEDAACELLGNIPAAMRGQIPPDAREKICARERSLSSYIGEGVCVPHARFENLEKPILILGYSPEGIAIPKGAERAHFLFVLLTPVSLPHAQVRILARIAGLVQSEYVRDHIRLAKSRDEVMEIIRSADPTGVS